ncbi:MAG TPA: FAD-dependent oxidoreductase [Pyrinomonadaceae bacterium]|nr:FAD-dependent oxidoreductase [Pyrinomonadaceae bacterium]
MSKPQTHRGGEDDGEREIKEVHRADCCIVGGGPAGALLALLLARKGLHVTLLEAHEDFDRDFRGDTLHPSVLEIMEQLGLAADLLKIRHTKIRTATFVLGGETVTVADFGRLKTRFPYIAMLPQVDFLNFIVAEAKRHPTFQLLMGARVEELIEEEGEVRGVRFREGAEWHEVRALLTIGADGRGSRVRHLCGAEPVKTSLPVDVLWFRLPREAGDPEGALGRFGNGHAVVMLDRLDEWQVGYVIFKGGYGQLRAAGVEALRRSLAEIVPEFAGRVGHLTDWKQVSFLSIESSRVERWHRPGLLLIGDAAHVMSPVGGVGINYAIQDAVVAANLLTKPLLAGCVSEAELARVQQERELPTRLIQAVQAFVQRRIIAAALNPRAQFRLPFIIRLLLRLPFIRNIPTRIIAFGFRRVTLKT